VSLHFGLFHVSVHRGSSDVTANSSYRISSSVSRDGHMSTEVNMTSSLDETFADVRRTLKHASMFRRVNIGI